jgi:hypothetical protein
MKADIIFFLAYLLIFFTPLFQPIRSLEAFAVGSSSIPSTAPIPDLARSLRLFLHFPLGFQNGI